MTIRVRLLVNSSLIRGIQRDIGGLPDVLDREVPRTVNRIVKTTRRDIATRLSADISGISKDDVISATKTKDARSKDWTGHVELSRRRVPVGKLNVRLGTKSDVVDIATPRQSAWLFYNVFRKKYGDSAIYSRAYRTVRKVYQNITYRVGGRTKSLAGTGAFPIKTGIGKMGIFKRIGRLGNLSEKLVEMRGLSLFQILDQQKAVMKKITDDNTREFERQLESMLDGRGVDLIPRIPIRRLTDAGVTV